VGENASKDTAEQIIEGGGVAAPGRGNNWVSGADELRGHVLFAAR